MYQIQATTDFAAAHHLVGYDGNCSNVHGHNWRVKACLEVDGVDDIGISVDFRCLKKSLNSLTAEMDHGDLNQHPAFNDVNPSSELIAKYIFHKLSEEFTSSTTRVAAVEVAESDDCAVVYYA